MSAYKNDYSKIETDMLILSSKIIYYILDVASDNDLKNEYYKITLERAYKLTKNTKVRKDIKENIDILFQTNVINYKEIKAELDTYPKEDVIYLIEKILSKTCGVENEKAIEINNWLNEYLETKKATPPHATLEEVSLFSPLKNIIKNIIKRR